MYSILHVLYKVSIFSLMLLFLLLVFFPLLIECIYRFTHRLSIMRLNTINDISDERKIK